MRRADYTYILGTCAGRNIILIEDLDLGNVSVVNDIDNVVKEIQLVERIDPNNYMIVHKNSSGMWDAWDHKKEQFILLQETDYREAIDKYILKQLAIAMA